MRPTYVQVCSRVDRGPGVGSNVVGIPPTSAAKREDWILYSTNKPIQSDLTLLLALVCYKPIQSDLTLLLYKQTNPYNHIVTSRCTYVWLYACIRTCIYVCMCARVRVYSCMYLGVYVTRIRKINIECGCWCQTRANNIKRFNLNRP